MFIAEFGKYKFTVLLFGSVGVPAIFQLLIMNTLHADVSFLVAAYIDDPFLAVHGLIISLILTRFSLDSRRPA